MQRAIDALRHCIARENYCWLTATESKPHWHTPSIITSHWRYHQNRMYLTKIQCLKRDSKINLTDATYCCETHKTKRFKDSLGNFYKFVVWLFTVAGFATKRQEEWLVESRGCDYVMSLSDRVNHAPRCRRRIKSPIIWTMVYQHRQLYRHQSVPSSTYMHVPVWKVLIVLAKNTGKVLESKVLTTWVLVVAACSAMAVHQYRWEYLRYL